MKVLVCLSLLIVATATCNNQTEDETETGARSHNDITPPEYSKVSQEVYKAHATPSSPLDPKTSPLPKFEPITYKTLDPPISTPTSQALRSEDYRKPIAIKAAPSSPVIYKPTPVVRRLIEEVNPREYNRQVYSIPRSVVQTYSAPAVRNLNENKDADTYSDDYTDQGVETDGYQVEQYPVVPVTVPLRVVHRRYRLPAYRRPSYVRLSNARQPVYRTVVPVRNFAYQYPSTSAGFRYAPNVRYDNGADPDYDGFIDVEYDEFLKKK